MKKVLGIDIGGTKILGGLVNENGTIEKMLKVHSFANEGRETLLDNLYKLIDSLMQEDIDAIGICSPGFVNYDEGVIEFAAGNLPGWTGCPLKKLISKRYNKKVIVENDANAAAIGEGWTGGAKSINNYVMIALGTGVGGAIVSEGKLLRGAHWSAGEFGHAVLIPGGRKCSCGEEGCLELYASGTAIYKRYNELQNIKKVQGALDVFKYAKEKDETAEKVVEEFIYYLAIALKNIKMYVDPETVVLGGGLIEGKEYWWDKLSKTLDKDIKISAAELGNIAGMIGAAKLSLDL